MYRKFELKISDSFYNEEIKPYSQFGNGRYNRDESKWKNDLKEFILKNERIDGVALKKHWFNQIKADIFISHSHNDLDKVKAFAGWLYQKFKLTTFIDSCVWGYCDDLLKEIDEMYCKNSIGNYDYNARNYSTSHVHMMLSIALTQMMDSTECVILYNTPNSVYWGKELEDIKVRKKKTLSPWIYYELANTKVLEEKEPLRLKKHIDDRKAMFESIKGPQIEQDVTEYIKDMTKLNDNILKKWKNTYCDGKENEIKSAHPLDILYAITNKI